MLLGRECQTPSYHFLSPCFMGIHWDKAEVAPCQISPIMPLSQPGLLTMLCRDHIVLWDTTPGKLKREPSCVLACCNKIWLYCLQKTHCREGRSAGLGRRSTRQDRSLACRDGSSFLGQQCSYTLALLHSNENPKTSSQHFFAYISAYIES